MTVPTVRFTESHLREAEEAPLPFVSIGASSNAGICGEIPMNATVLCSECLKKMDSSAVGSFIYQTAAPELPIKRQNNRKYRETEDYLWQQQYSSGERDAC